MKYYELNPKTSEQHLADAEAAWLLYDENFSEFAAGCAKMSHDQYIADFMERRSDDEKKKEQFRSFLETFTFFDDFFSLVESRFLAGEDEYSVVRSFDKLHDEIRRKAHDGEIAFTWQEVDSVARYVRILIIAIARGRFSPSSADETEADAAPAAARSFSHASPADSFAAASLASAEANAFEQHMTIHDDDGLVYHPCASTPSIAKKFTVQYSGGESLRGDKSVDYMLVTVEHDGEEYRLYAEIPPADLEDENGIPACDEHGWNPEAKAPEWLSFPYLKAAILDLCKQIGFDPSALDFGMGDDMPTYMMPYTQADSRID